MASQLLSRRRQSRHPPRPRRRSNKVAQMEQGGVLGMRSFGHKRPVSSCAFDPVRVPAQPPRKPRRNKAPACLTKTTQTSPQSAQCSQRIASLSIPGKTKSVSPFPFSPRATEMSESLQSEATLLLAKVASRGLFTQVFLSSTSSSKSRSDGHPNLERWVLVTEGNASRRMNAQRFISCFSDFVFPPESYGPISWSPTILRRRSNPGFIFRRLFLRQKCRQRVQRMGRTGHIQFHSQSRHHRRRK